MVSDPIYLPIKAARSKLAGSRRIQQALDQRGVRCCLWLVLILAGGPVLLLSLMGLVVGFGWLWEEGVQSSGAGITLMGLAGSFGLAGAAARLAISADTLARSNIKRRLVIAGLCAGSTVAGFATIPLIAAASSEMDAWLPMGYMVGVTLVGLVLLLGTISIAPQAPDDVSDRPN